MSYRPFFIHCLLVFCFYAAVASAPVLASSPFAIAPGMTGYSAYNASFGGTGSGFIIYSPAGTVLASGALGAASNGWSVATPSGSAGSNGSVSVTVPSSASLEDDYSGVVNNAGIVYHLFFDVSYSSGTTGNSGSTGTPGTTGAGTGTTGNSGSTGTPGTTNSTGGPTGSTGSTGSTPVSSAPCGMDYSAELSKSLGPGVPHPCDYFKAAHAGQASLAPVLTILLLFIFGLFGVYMAVPFLRRQFPAFFSEVDTITARASGVSFGSRPPGWAASTDKTPIEKHQERDARREARAADRASSKSEERPDSFGSRMGF